MTTSSSRGPRPRRITTPTSAPESEAAEPAANRDGETLPAPQIPAGPALLVLGTGATVLPLPGHVLVRGRSYPMADAMRLGMIEPEPEPEPTASETDDGAP